MNDDTQKPWSVQVGITFGCTRLCSFCGMRNVVPKAGQFKFMRQDVASALAQKVGEYCPNARVEFAMHGEPLANKDHPVIFSAWRRAMPKTQMMVTTNGDPLLGAMQRKLENIFNSGINFVLLDVYEGPKRDRLLAEVNQLEDINVVNYYDSGFPVYTNQGTKVQDTLVLMGDISHNTGKDVRRVLTNHAGNNKTLPVPAEPLRKTCVKPFRELVIMEDGSVLTCCNDWGRQLVAGDLLTQDLANIWEGPVFQAVRRCLYERKRTFSPCAHCDQGPGMRVGLLRNQGPFTPDDAEVLANALSKSPRINGVAPFCRFEF